MWDGQRINIHLQCYKKKIQALRGLQVYGQTICKSIIHCNVVIFILFYVYATKCSINQFLYVIVIVK